VELEAAYLESVAGKPNVGLRNGDAFRNAADAEF
jgi:hypothetical protein